MIKTKFDSFCCNGFAEGCRLCVQGKKLVLFVTGKCSRACAYCSLSNKRKNKDIIWANERECKSIKDVLEEARASNSKGAGITGGDPLIVLNRTIKLTRALKTNFGKSFHLHIYLPTNLVTKEKLRKLKKAGVDEVRFHPSLSKEICEEISKIKLSKKFWPRKNIGIEVPMFPDKKEDLLNFIIQIHPFIGFVNLNELEISDTNFNYIKSRYKLNEDTYTIKGSKEAGLWILKQIEKKQLGLKVHLCTARTKNLFQYKNRIKLRKIMPFGYKTEQGSVRYFIIDLKDYKKREINDIVRKFKGSSFLDIDRERIILLESSVKKALKQGYKVERVEELPTFDAIELERETI